MAEDQHPAEALGATLVRIDTLLSALGTMFEPGREGFAVDQAFVMHSLVAAQGLVVTAQRDLQLMHESCDLSLIDHGLSEPASPFIHAAEDDLPEEEASAEAEPIPYAPFVSATRFVDELTSSAANSQDEEAMLRRASDSVDRPVNMDGFAQSYLELLRKLTAAEIFAAEQQALSPPGTPHQLLPLLRSLREDFQKIHSAA